MKDSSLVQSLIIFKACDSVSTVKYIRYFTLYSLTKLLKLSSTYFSWRSWIFALGSKICFTKDGIYAKANKTSESKYAIVWVYNTDKSNLKDEIKKSLTSISNFSTKNTVTHFLFLHSSILKQKKNKVETLFKIIFRRFFYFLFDWWFINIKVILS